MGILLEEQPTLTDLHNLITKVPGFPITAKQVVDIANKKGSPKTVTDFYRAFPDDEIFEDKDDLIARTESIEMLHYQSAPREDIHTSEED